MRTNAEPRAAVLAGVRATVRLEEQCLSQRQIAATLGISAPVRCVLLKRWRDWVRARRISVQA